MSQRYKLTPNSSDGFRSVVHSIKPVSSFHSVPGFFNIAHRGASFYAPENTLPSFQKAIEMKADMIELDVTLSRDKIPMVIHDSKLQRTTNGRGLVQNFYERELRVLDAGEWFSPEFRGTVLPRLEDVLKWASKKTVLNIEIKKEAVKKNPENGIVQLVHELLKECEMTDQVIISSFSRLAVKRSWEVSPDIPTAYLMSPYALGTVKEYRLMKKLNATGLNMKPHQMRKKLMSLADKNRSPVWVYTVDEEREMAKVIKKGASGIFTNRPDVLRQVASGLFRDYQE